MKTLLTLTLFVGALLWLDFRHQFLPPNSQLQAIERKIFGAFGARGEGPVETLEDFAAAIALGKMDLVDRLSGSEEVKKQASGAYLAMRRSSVRQVLFVSYRREGATQADGNSATVTVSQALNLDPDGSFSAFGTLSCEGKYNATLTKTDSKWKVTRFSVEAPSTPPPTKQKLRIWYDREQVEWPCADSPWTKFSETWNEAHL